MASRTLTLALVAVAAGAPLRAQTLTIGAAAEIVSVDPHFQPTSANNALLRHVFNGLSALDETGRVVPALAESWTVRDPLTWEVRLRKDARFHDGRNVTAEDVAFTIERVPNVPNTPSSYAAYVRTIAKVEVVDAHTLVLTTTRPDPLLMHGLTTIGIIARHVAEGRGTADFNSGAATIGSGPFRFVEWVPGSRWVLDRNDAYWGPRPHWERVTFQPLQNNTARTAALLSGSVDVIEQVPPADFARISAEPRFHVVSGPSTRLIHLQVNAASDAAGYVTSTTGAALPANPLRDLRVRQAISRAINRAALVERVLEGQGVAASQFLAAGMYGTSDELPDEPFDPEGAKRLLAEAGFADGFKLVLAGPNNRYVNDARVLQAIAQMLIRIGIRTDVQAVPFSTYPSRMARQEMGLGLLGVATAFLDTGSQMDNMVAAVDAGSGKGIFNYMRYANPALDALLGQARGTFAQDERARLLGQASAIAIRDLAIIPLYFQTASWALPKALTMRPHPAEYTLAQEIAPAP